MISKADLSEFQKIYEQQYNEKIDEAEALKLATNLLNLYKVVYLSPSNHMVTPKNNNQLKRKQYKGIGVH